MAAEASRSALPPRAGAIRLAARSTPSECCHRCGSRSANTDSAKLVARSSTLGPSALPLLDYAAVTAVQAQMPRFLQLSNNFSHFVARESEDYNQLRFTRKVFEVIEVPTLDLFAQRARSRLDIRWRSFRVSSQEPASALLVGDQASLAKLAKSLAECCSCDAAFSSQLGFSGKAADLIPLAGGDSLTEGRGNVLGCVAYAWFHPESPLAAAAVPPDRVVTDHLHGSHASGSLIQPRSTAATERTSTRPLAASAASAAACLRSGTAGTLHVAR